MESFWIAGLDLGQTNDRTALVIAERIDESYHWSDLVDVWPVINGITQSPIKKLKLPNGQLVDPPEQTQARYEVRHIMRWPIGTDYPAMVTEVARIMDDPRLSEAILVVDGTGVGRPVVDLFRKMEGRSFSVVPVTITSGGATHTDEWGYTLVSKRDLVGAVAVNMQKGLLGWPSRHPEASILEKELKDFKVKITDAGNDTYNARTGKHDDLVLSLALCLWQGERGRGVRAYWLD